MFFNKLLLLVKFCRRMEQLLGDPHDELRGYAVKTSDILGRNEVLPVGLRYL